MSISVPNEILKSIKASLETITTANGYYTDVVKVERGVRSIEDFEGNLPSIAIWKQNVTPAPQSYMESEHSLFLHIWGYVECESMFSDFDPLDKLVVDVQKAITTATNNSYYEDTSIGVIAFYEGGVEENFGIFDMEATIKYDYEMETTGV